MDGVISLFGFDPARPPAGKFQIVDGIAHFLSQEAGRHLRLLCQSFDPVWCTGWEEKANEYLPLAMGLPGPFPFLTFAHAAGPGASTRGHWKLDAIDAYAGSERPLAWIDDAHDASCRTWAAARPAPTLLIGTDPARGLHQDHVQELLRWSRDPGRSGA